LKSDPLPERAIWRIKEHDSLDREDRMKKICVLAILMVSVGRAQPPPESTPAQVVVSDAPYKVTEDVAAPGAIRPPTGSVSVAQLRHKPPKNAQKAVARGAKFSQAGDHQRAAEEFERAVAADPEFANAYDHLGAEYAQLTRYPEAEAALQRSLTLDPASWTGHYYLALTLYQKGDLSAAQRSARRALELSQNDVKVHTLLGLLLWHPLETRAEALEHLQYAARSSSEAKKLLASLSGK
jgi:tetratricopeptide (TPR) repeat protein